MSADGKERELDRIHSTLETIRDRLSDMNITIAKQEENLKEHMRRTDQNENMIKSLETSIEPIKKHVSMVEGALKLVGLVASIAAIATSFYGLIQYLTQ